MIVWLRVSVKTAPAQTAASSGPDLGWNVIQAFMSYELIIDNKLVNVMIKYKDWTFLVSTNHSVQFFCIFCRTYDCVIVKQICIIKTINGGRSATTCKIVKCPHYVCILASLCVPSYFFELSSVNKSVLWSDQTGAWDHFDSASKITGIERSGLAQLALLHLAYTWSWLAWS